MNPRYHHSIFIPCYNRGAVLNKTLQSVANLDYLDFEVIIINDGSRDNTDEIAQQWISKKLFSIQYFTQSNQGKHVAHNKAVSLARGYFFITLDAGDFILKDALSQIDKYWSDINEGLREKFAGVSGLCLSESGEISGFRYPEEIIDSNYFDIFRVVPIGGEKREAIITSILKDYLFPVYGNEKLIRPDLILRQISRKYKFRFINVPLEVNVREANGYTANIYRFRVTSPRSFYHYFREEINENYQYNRNKKIFYYYTRYIRYALHCRINLFSQSGEVKNKLLWLAALPSGVLGWIKDVIQKKNMAI
ncbi:MAG TPA: glycosyltransferase family 2 protein [Acidiferrobacteraceae bacterium]|nr:glycosyltransferase family 2 protein [Acidiferrobacteraceae bacterium]